ncbi:Nuclear pore complex protein Nup54 [Chamberlinius hualienensis]
MAAFGTGFGSFGQRTDVAGTSGGGFSFGTTTAGVPNTTTTTSSFNFGGIGSGAPATGGFTGFSNPTNPSQSLFGAQQPTSTTAASGFGGFSFGASAPTVTTAAGFGSGGFSLGSNTFPTTTASTGFSGFNFGQPTAAATTTTSSSFGGFGGFGTTGFGTGLTSTTSLFGKPALGQQQLQQQQQQQSVSTNEQSMANLMASLFCPVLYGDERDAIIAKFNQLQAFWGTGNGFYANGAPPISFTPENVYCKFKAVGYSCLPTSKNESGLVSLILDKTDIEVRTLQPQLVDGLFKILGSQPTLSVCVEGVKPSAENKAEVTVYLLERAPTGLSKRVTATDLYNYFNQPNIKLQLTTFGVEKVIIKAKPSSEQLRHYMETPQSGIDQMVWQQACKDNPDPERFIPVPMIGFAELNRRLKHQEEETKVHDSRLELIGNELTELQNKLISREAKISEFKRKHLELCNRILKIMIKHEISRKLGLALQADEEQLRVKLESISTELNAPNQAKGRLNELMAQIRLQKENFLNYVPERYNMDPDLQDELKRHLKKEQQGLIHLVNVLKSDGEILKLAEVKLKDEQSHK